MFFFINAFQDLGAAFASRCIGVRKICGGVSKKMLYVCDFDQLHGEVKKQSIFSDSRLDRNHPPVSFFMRVFKSVNWVMQIISYTDTLYLCHLCCALLVSHVILQCCPPMIFVCHHLTFPVSHSPHHEWWTAISSRWLLIVIAQLKQECFYAVKPPIWKICLSNWIGVKIKISETTTSAVSLLSQLRPTFLRQTLKQLVYLTCGHQRTAQMPPSPTSVASLVRIQYPTVPAGLSAAGLQTKPAIAKHRGCASLKSVASKASWRFVYSKYRNVNYMKVYCLTVH